jgi:Calx-beta domain/FG-GAP-like repeat/FG-GAP repeat
MLLDSILSALQLRRRLKRSNHRPALRRPRFEALEDRCLLSLTPAVSFPVGASPLAVVTGDFNGDGHLDLATGNPVAAIQYESGTVSVLLGDGAGGFGAAIVSPLGAYGFNRVSLTAADFDNDGDDDLAFAVHSTETGEAGGPGVLLSNGDGTFGSPTWPPASGYYEAVASGDFNNDGHSDLVVTGYKIDIFGQGWWDARVLLGNGHGGFAYSPYSGLIDGSYEQLAVGDLNGDGKLDAVGTSGEFYGSGIALLGNGAAFGVFSTYAGFYTTSDRSGDVTVGDFTGDGIPDLVTAGGTLDIHIGRGDGTFDEPTAYSTNANEHTGVAVADFNGDGKLDAVVSEGDTGTVSLLLGNGDGTLRYTGAFAVGSSPSAVAVGDGTFSPAENFAVASGTSAAVTDGDFNSDGKVDAADYVVWRKNGGRVGEYDAWRATFGESTAPGTDPRPVALVTGDFNGDGRLDVATANANANSVSVLFNDQLSPVLPPGVSVSDATVTEGNSGTVNATFTLTLSKPTNADVTVRYDTANGTAMAGSDYTATSGTVTIPAGQTSRTFAVAVLGDRLAEPAELFGVNLSAPTNATISDGQGTGTVVDNEPRISINDVARSEGKGNKTTLFTFTITLSAAYDQPVTMSYQTVNGTATTADNDYIAKTGTLTFNPGETTKTITIEVKADNKKESDETFYLDLINNSSNSLFSKFRGIGTIWNDD